MGYFSTLDANGHKICILYRVLAEEELQTNISEKDVFTLPSGQEIEKEHILFMNNCILKNCDEKVLGIWRENVIYW